MSELNAAMIYEWEKNGRVPRCVLCGRIFQLTEELALTRGGLGDDQTFIGFLYGIRCVTCDADEASRAMIEKMAEEFSGKGIAWRRGE